MHADSPKWRGKADVVCLLLALSFLHSSLAAGAAESAGTEVVVAGTGKTVAAALRNALRNAVESVVGTLIDSESMIENDELVNDRILAHSSGFVESYREIGEPRQTGDGLVMVRIRATVGNKAVIHALETANIRGGCGEKPRRIQKELKRPRTFIMNHAEDAFSSLRRAGIAPTSSCAPE